MSTPPAASHPRVRGLAAAALAAVALLTACGSSDTEATPSESPTTASSSSVGATKPSEDSPADIEPPTIESASDTASHLAEDAAVLLAMGGGTETQTDRTKTPSGKASPTQREPIAEPLEATENPSKDQQGPYTPADAILDAVIDGNYPTDPAAGSYVHVVGEQGLVTVMTDKGDKSTASVCYDRKHMMFYTVKGPRCLPPGKA